LSSSVALLIAVFSWSGRRALSKEPGRRTGRVVGLNQSLWLKSSTRRFL